MLDKASFIFLMITFFLLITMNLHAQDQERSVIQLETYHPKLIETSCDFYPDFNGMGYYYLENREFDKALDAFKTYLVLASNDPYAHYSMGYFYTVIGEHDKAIPYYEQAAALGMNTAQKRER